MFAAGSSRRSPTRRAPRRPGSHRQTCQRAPPLARITASRSWDNRARPSTRRTINARCAKNPISRRGGALHRAYSRSTQESRIPHQRGRGSFLWESASSEFTPGTRAGGGSVIGKTNLAQTSSGPISPTLNIGAPPSPPSLDAFGNHAHGTPFFTQAARTVACDSDLVA